MIDLQRILHQLTQDLFSACDVAQRTKSVRTAARNNIRNVAFSQDLPCHFPHRLLEVDASRHHLDVLDPEKLEKQTIAASANHVRPLNPLIS